MGRMSWLVVLAFVVGCGVTPSGDAGAESGSADAGPCLLAAPDASRSVRAGEPCVDHADCVLVDGSATLRCTHGLCTLGCPSMDSAGNTFCEDHGAGEACVAGICLTRCETADCSRGSCESTGIDPQHPNITYVFCYAPRACR